MGDCLQIDMLGFADAFDCGVTKRSEVDLKMVGVKNCMNVEPFTEIGKTRQLRSLEGKNVCFGHSRFHMLMKHPRREPLNFRSEV